ncbi:MAG: type II toxin-antitoxin system MqsA family antitoxin [Nanoarchaeota archaeon]|nr:type II toxin-antitoxin system MqsA family antitoxin [Nanoarchaeota archaeon]MBU1005652.1 type II toxin-antitoxin system MqsA family antitoxin [Nanoarchaeota archaeon]MBU1946923.1 type II toxin-antitoxin system MqsA family antitoxin [Nanoarchaeota archaeon]
MKCYICNKGELVKKEVPRELYGKAIGKFKAEVCSHCNEAFYDEETSRKITEKTKKMGLWGLEARTKIGVSGSVLDVRLNKNIVNFFHLKKGKEVRIYPEDEKRFVVELA